MKSLLNSILAPLRGASLIAAIACLGQVASAQFAPQILSEDFVRNHPIGQLVGRVEANRDRNGFEIGTATAIKRRSILTCGHVLYSRERGWARGVVFKRSYYDGSSFAPKRALRKFVLSGYVQSVQTGGPTAPESFANDFGGVILNGLAAQGASAPWIAEPGRLGSNAAKYIFGYGSEPANGVNGEKLLVSASYAPYVQQFGMWLVNGGMGIHGGMSGGPVWVDTGSGIAVAAVNVSGRRDDYTRFAGCRAIDEQAARLIERNLR